MISEADQDGIASAFKKVSRNWFVEHDDASDLAQDPEWEHKRALDAAAVIMGMAMTAPFGPGGTAMGAGLASGLILANHYPEIVHSEKRNNSDIQRGIHHGKRFSTEELKEKLKSKPGWGQSKHIYEGYRQELKARRKSK